MCISPVMLRMQREDSTGSLCDEEVQVISSIVSENLQQAIRILGELGIDAWLTFVRETTEKRGPNY